MSDFNIQFEEQDQSITLEFEQIGGGAVKSVNGKTGAVVLDAGDLEYDDTETYSSGSVGDAISDVKNDLDLNSLTSEVKAALLNCFDHLAWGNQQGQSYREALRAALYDRYWAVTNNLSHCVSSQIYQFSFYKTHHYCRLKSLCDSFCNFVSYIY